MATGHGLEDTAAVCSVLESMAGYRRKGTKKHRAKRA
jgi:hypothetical protein